MKKWLCILAAFALAALCVPALANAGNETLLVVGEGQPITSGIDKLALVNDTLYAYDYDGFIYSLDMSGERVWRKHAFDGAVFSDGERYTSMNAFVAYGDNLYAVLIDQINTAEESRVDGAYLYRVEIEGDAAILRDELELDWYDMTESYDSYEYSRNIEGAFMQDDKLIFTTYGYSTTGQDLMVFDMRTGEAVRYDVPSLRSAHAYMPGSVLLVTFDYSSQPLMCDFSSMDLATEEVTPLAQFKLEGYYSPSGIVYDAGKNTLYYTLDGELLALPNMDASKITPVAAITVHNSSVPPMLTKDGFYITCDYNTIIKRNTDPELRAQTRLSVVDNYDNASQQAYQEFTAAHGDVEVVLRNYQNDIITAMMSHSPDIDVYTLSVSSPDYAALINRGYLMELTSSEFISGFVNSMYPNLTDMLKRNGEVLAVPISLDSQCNSYNPKAFEAAGLSEQDLPKSWLEFLTLLKRLPDIINDDMQVSAFDPYYTVDDARMEVFNYMFNDYMLYIIKGDEADMRFDTPALRDLLKAFEEIDFKALGLMESYDEFNMRVVEYQPTEVMFTMYGIVSAHANNYNNNLLPMPLSIIDGEQPMITTYMDVAFVNPYSQNRELALEYVELVARNIAPIVKVHASPEYNQPIPNPYSEDTLRYYYEAIESYRALLATAEDDEKAYYEQMIKEFEQYAADFEEYGSWTANEESIARYRKYVRLCVPYETLRMDSDGSNVFYTARSQYLNGEIDAETMLKNIDKKLKMMLMEGI